MLCEIEFTGPGIRWLQSHNLLQIGDDEEGVPWGRFYGRLYFGEVMIPVDGGVMYTLRRR